MGNMLLNDQAQQQTKMQFGGTAEPNGNKGRTKLTDWQQDYIRRNAGRFTITHMGEALKVDPTTIRRWAGNVGLSLQVLKEHDELTEHDYYLIRTLDSEGMDRAEICNKFNIKRRLCNLICTTDLEASC